MAVNDRLGKAMGQALFGLDTYATDRVRFPIILRGVGPLLSWPYLGLGMGSSHKEFMNSLTTQDKMLITLRDELYFGSWERMETDLKDRLKGRPYIFKLVNRIEEDLKRIEKLQAYELKHDINLSDYLEESEE